MANDEGKTPNEPGEAGPHSYGRPPGQGEGRTHLEKSANGSGKTPNGPGEAGPHSSRALSKPSEAFPHPSDRFSPQSATRTLLLLPVAGGVG
jgi:hypothetical protein